MARSRIFDLACLIAEVNSDLFSSIVDVHPPTSPTDSFAAMIVNQESRDKLRNSAQLVLAALEQEGHVDE